MKFQIALKIRTMKYLLILFALVVFQLPSISQKAKNIENISTSNVDSLEYVKLEREVDSLTLVLNSLKDFKQYADSIKIISDTLENRQTLLKKTEYNVNIEKIKISKTDTIKVYNELKILKQNDDSIKVLVLLDRYAFNDKLSLANSKDDFCNSTQKFIQGFLPDLYLYYFRNGKNADLTSNKKRATAIFEEIFNGTKNKYFYDDLVSKTFLNANSNEEFSKYLEVLMNVDISKCD